jgi:hypothetical protein
MEGEIGGARGRAGLRGALLLAVGLLVAACGDDAPSPGEAFDGGFVDVREQAGIEFHNSFLPGEQGANFKINLYDHGAGVAAGDIDGDGDDDLYFVNQLGPNALYRNDGGGRFADVTATAGPVALGDRICVCALFNDLDEDGDQDLFVTSTRGGNALLLNDGKGRFVEATERAGLTWVGHTQNATAFDGDGDGDLDLLISNTAGWTTEVRHATEQYYEGVPGLYELVDSPKEYNVYFRNRGDGTFEDATEEAGLRGPGWAGDVAVFDYDADGDSDLFVANMFGRSTLYENDGKGRFSNVTRRALGRTPFGTVGARAFDFDGDGHLDLYLVDMHSDMWMPSDYGAEKIDEKAKYRGFHGALLDDPNFDVRRARLFNARMGVDTDEVFFGNALYRNRGDGTFEEVSDERGAETFWPWGIAAADFDNDTDLDVFLPSGMGYPFFFWRNYLLVNDGTGRFVDRAGQAGLDPPPGGEILGEIGGLPATRSSRSAAVLDFDADGRLDLVVNNFNDHPYVYKNRFPKRDHVAFRLEGTASNRDAIGAVLRLEVGGRRVLRFVQAAGGYLAQSSKTVHYGFAAGTSIGDLEIRWPSGTVQTVEVPATGRTYRIREPRG